MNLDTGSIKQRRRAMWAAGDHPDIARTIAPVSDVVVEAAVFNEAEDGSLSVDPEYLLTVVRIPV